MRKYFLLVAATMLVACNDDRPTGADADPADALKSSDVAADQATPADSADASSDAPSPGDAPVPPDAPLDVPLEAASRDGASDVAADAAFDALAEDAAPDAPTPDTTADAMSDAADDLGARCTPGTTRVCYGGAAGTSGVGRCRGGLQLCTPAGAYDPACLGEQLPAAMETCGNMVDDDCDGTVDDGCGECTPGTTRACYAGPSGTMGVGRCAGGRQVCDATRAYSGPCAGEVTPVTEVCRNMVDDDCDGMTDEGCGECAPGSSRACYGGPAGTAGVGRCRGGTQFCNASGGYDACLGEQLPAAETCGNGVDDDCNGTVDDACGECVPEATRICYTGPAGTSGIGLCRAGTQTCGADRRWATACAGEVLPAAEACNGRDDNCDGTPDDGAGAACTLANATAACRAGACAVAACASGFGDCDAAPANGCEVALATTPTNCGACGNACATGQTCAAGVCTGGPGGDLAAGQTFACALLPGGRVACWGTNHVGQLGSGEATARLAPVLVAGLGDAVDVESGQSALHACAIRSGGAAVCWGSNDRGQLGDGTTMRQTTPVAVAGLTDAVQLALGVLHSCALRRTGRVVCWGFNSSGQLGDGTTATRPSPTEVTGLNDATQVTAGAFHTCALRATGAVVCWGNSDYGQTGGGSFTARLVPGSAGVSGATAVAAGTSHTCAIRAGGVVSCWGANEYGQHGDGGRATGRATAVDTVAVVDAEELALGSNHTCARRRGGTVACWGRNNRGQLGDGTTVDRLTSVAATGLADVVRLAVGGEFSCARRSSGALSCWGVGGDGQLGDGRALDRALGNRDVFGLPAPVPCSGAGCALPLALGTGFSCALRPGGGVVCWGVNTIGQLGDGSSLARSAPYPVDVAGAATHLAAGATHACARLSGGGVRCWGINNYGQLGAARPLASSTPLTIPGLADAEDVVAGADHNCARTRSGNVRCWGLNSSGQLGDGSTDDRPTPGLVGGPSSPISDVVSVAAGGRTTCAVRTGGAVWCWGANNNGQVGDGTTTTASLPVPVRAPDGGPGALMGATQVAVGGVHACALRSGTVICWGANYNAQLGGGAAGGTSPPVTVPGLSDAVEIGAGDLHNCARRAGGAVVCWGSNVAGQLGDGTTVTRRPPMPVAGISDALALSLGDRHTCVRRAGGAVTCWGYGTGGGLGDGTLSLAFPTEMTTSPRGTIFGLP